jgi:hypothetical protein
MSMRSAREVLEDHLNLRQQGSVELDVSRNYAEDVRHLSAEGVRVGHDGVRAAARELLARLPEPKLGQVRQLVDGEIAFIEWTAEGRDRYVLDGVETFVIRDGLIRVQTVHYTVCRGPHP